jgi:hypothetical protein
MRCLTRPLASPFFSRSPPSAGLTPAHLFTRSRDPSAVFSSYDAAGGGVVSLDDARAAFAQLGMKLTLTEARALARAQAGGDRGVPHAELTFDYGSFLRGAGAHLPRAAGGVEPPRAAGDALAAMTGRLEKDRGGERGEGYAVQLNAAPPRAFREYPGRRSVSWRRGLRRARAAGAAVARGRR